MAAITNTGRFGGGETRMEFPDYARGVSMFLRMSRMNEKGEVSRSTWDNILNA